ncbi:XdhC family protein [Luteolibacter flavescens]|uniref:XdhC family protein n=1 Tax=Luteolibacter flavescens TaxID=1859460 RepID=A0ABT3FN42_9BACT|nr:XdhC family protein [Luteolibacter flavescens]MCW1884993.1 XdhC family protein [Luteolibacter flavescens]
MTDWPFLFDFARQHRGGQLALATLVAREGSSYRQPGARMLIAEDLSFSGSLSGGCLEEGIANTARKVFSDGTPQRMVIDTRPHFGCPGKLHVQVEEIAHELIGWIESELRERRSLLLVTDARSTRIAAGETSDLLEKVVPPPRLVAVGWTPDMEPLLGFAAALGWERHRVLRDQRMIAETPRVAGESVRVLAAEEMTAHFAPDAATAVLVMTHHLATDLSFLREILPAGYGYVGLLGSKRRRETLLAELGELGLLEDPEVTERLHAPVGLDLGGHHPATISLAIAAEIQAVLAGAGGGFLRDKTGTIHPQPEVMALG